MLVALFMLFAGWRVFLFSASFPLFNNVDEGAHIDLVLKYSHGHIPDTLETYSNESALYMATYSTYGYAMVTGPNLYPYNPKTAGNEERIHFEYYLSLIKLIYNHEFSQPPLYYLVAGLWADVGSQLGLKSALLIYWIRFLNIIFIVALVYISYLIALLIFPENRSLVLSVPLLVAALPQDTYYSVQSDVLSPLCFGLTFLSLLKFLLADVPSIKQGVFLGFFLAATVLVKLSNLPLLFLVLIILSIKMRALYLEGKLKVASLSLLGIFVCILIPLVAWAGWNLSHYGDLTGSEVKMKLLAWTYKPISTWLNHPLFTREGVIYFWKNLMITFWRGELVWAGKIVSSPDADYFYWISSFLLLSISMIFAQRKTSPWQSSMNIFSFWSFGSLVLFMALLSICFDFGNCTYPSQANPFFTSGRLVSAALIPFLLLYAQGLNWLLKWIKSDYLRLTVICLLVVSITLNELEINKALFNNHFNWFSL